MLAIVRLHWGFKCSCSFRTVFFSQWVGKVMIYHMKCKMQNVVVACQTRRQMKM